MLRDGRGIEKEDVGFSNIDGCAISLREGVKQIFEGSGFLYRRMAKEKVIIHKFLMSNGGVVVERDTFNRTGGGSMMNESTKAFSHEHKKERR